MAVIQHIKCNKSTEIVAKSPKFCTLTGNRGWGNRTTVSKFTPEVYKYPFLRMRSTNVAENSRKCDYMLNV